MLVLPVVKLYQISPEIRPHNASMCKSMAGINCGSFSVQLVMRCTICTGQFESSSFIQACFCFLAFKFCRFCVVIRFFSSPPQRPMNSDFEGFSIPDFIHYIYCPILILEKEPVFPFLMFSAKQGNYWYHFITSLIMTRSLTED